MAPERPFIVMQCVLRLIQVARTRAFPHSTVDVELRRTGRKKVLNISLILRRICPSTLACALDVTRCFCALILLKSVRV